MFSIDGLSSTRVVPFATPRTFINDDSLRRSATSRTMYQRRGEKSPHSTMFPYFFYMNNLSIGTPPFPPPGPPPPLRTTPHACKITSAVQRVHMKIMPYLAIPHGKDREEYTSYSWPTTPPSLLYYMRTRTHDVSAPDRPVREENIFENRASSFRIGTTPHTHTNRRKVVTYTTHAHARAYAPSRSSPFRQSNPPYSTYFLAVS
jgi:hypothetical protein